MDEAVKRQGGRAVLSATSPTTKILINVTVEQKEKLKRLGGAPWIRERIDKAKEPKKE